MMHATRPGKDKTRPDRTGPDTMRQCNSIDVILPLSRSSTVLPGEGTSDLGPTTIQPDADTLVQSPIAFHNSCRTSTASR
jgi:hypothetical protein